MRSDPAKDFIIISLCVREILYLSLTGISCNGFRAHLKFICLIHCYSLQCNYDIPYQQTGSLSEINLPAQL